MKKRMTITIDKIDKGLIKGQLVAEGKGKGVKVKFDIIENLYNIKDNKIIIEIRETPPAKLDKYIFCGHGYEVVEPKADAFKERNYTIISVWGILFRFEPKLSDIEPNKKYYICIKPASQ
ncbi:MAG: DNA-directed RNA polymerase subunit G [Desulfurococcales archaeon]|nr:DNA-directed RNA polymerase subunit G [Desulfurococcales archaeon]